MGNMIAFVRSNAGRLGAGAAVAAGLAGATAAGPSPASAQAVQELDAGTYEIRVGEGRVGTESFAIRREGSAVKAVGRITREGEASGPRGMEVRLQTNLDFRPNAYGMRAQGGAVTDVTGIWEGDRLRLHVTSAEGERWKEFLTRGAVAVLERGVAHHYYVLFRHLPSDPSGSRVSVIVPSRHEQVTATVSGGASEPVDIGGDRVSARRYEVDVDGARGAVWLDDDGRVLRVSFPGENRVAVRQP